MRRLYKWKLKVSDHENGLFNVKIIFPKDQPKYSPECYFMNKDLYHLIIKEEGFVGKGNTFHLYLELETFFQLKLMDYVIFLY